MKTILAILILAATASAQSLTPSPFPRPGGVVLDLSNGVFVVTWAPQDSGVVVGSVWQTPTIGNPAWTNYWHAYGPTSTVAQVVAGMHRAKWEALSVTNLLEALKIETDINLGMVDMSALNLKATDTLTGVAVPPPTITP